MLAALPLVISLLALVQSRDVLGRARARGCEWVSPCFPNPDAPVVEFRIC